MLNEDDFSTPYFFSISCEKSLFKANFRLSMQIHSISQDQTDPYSFQIISLRTVYKFYTIENAHTVNNKTNTVLAFLEAKYKN